MAQNSSNEERERRERNNDEGLITTKTQQLEGAEAGRKQLNHVHGFPCSNRRPTNLPTARDQRLLHLLLLICTYGAIEAESGPVSFSLAATCTVPCYISRPAGVEPIVAKTRHLCFVQHAFPVHSA